MTSREPNATAASNRWRGRRAGAFVVDAAVVLTPIGAATVTLWAVAAHLHMHSTVVRVALLLLVSSVAAYLSERAARRLVPLGSLLRLTMVFPDRAPSRFSIARQAGNPRELMARLQSSDIDEATAAQTILSLVTALAVHDRKTRGHSERVRAYTDLLTAELGLPEHARDRLRWSALLHDVGKLRVPDAVLNKPGKPTEREWNQLRAHPGHGRELAAPLLPWLGEWGRAIVEHHERYDGMGYPEGLGGDAISLGGRIVAVVDSFETMTAARSYKKAMTHKAAREELSRCAGTQFDGSVVRAFLSVSLPRVLWAMGPFSAVLQLPWVSTLQYAGSRTLSFTAGAGAGAITGPVLAASVATVAVAPSVAAAPSAHQHRPAAVASQHAHKATTSGHASSQSGGLVPPSSASSRSAGSGRTGSTGPTSVAQAPRHGGAKPSPAAGTTRRPPRSPQQVPSPPATTASSQPAAPSAPPTKPTPAGPPAHPTPPATPPAKPTPPARPAPPPPPAKPPKPPKPPKPSKPPKPPKPSKPPKSSAPPAPPAPPKPPKPAKPAKPPKPPKPPQPSKPPKAPKAG